jgi:hypothetical protein
LTNRIRKVGGGRRNKESCEPKLRKKFDEVIDSHTAGCPVHGTRWTYLSIEEIRKKILDKGIKVCREVVYRLLSKADLGKRKMSKDTVMKEVEGRNEQFERIKSLKRYHLARGHAVLSIDAKKKEYLGDFYRSGRVLADGKVACYDHDFNSFATGKIVPQGIYDLGLNTGYMFIGTSGDTAEFSAECIRRWWNKHGNTEYDKAQPILILCDGGGSNGSRNSLFKEQVQQLADELGMKFIIAHYPPYCSKYNPIEHRLFPAVTRYWSGIKLDSAQTAKKLIDQRNTDLKSGLKIKTQIIHRKFLTGKKKDEKFWETCNIKHDKVNSNWNYRIAPTN